MPANFPFKSGSELEQWPAGPNAPKSIWVSFSVSVCAIFENCYMGRFISLGWLCEMAIVAVA